MSTVPTMANDVSECGRDLAKVTAWTDGQQQRLAAILAQLQQVTDEIEAYDTACEEDAVRHPWVEERTAR